MSFHVFSCAACGHAVYPARYLCPACHGAQWRETPAPQGIIEETTATRHKIGADQQQVLHLATVRTSAGPAVIAKLDGPAQEGDTVELAMEQGALRATPSGPPT